MELLDSYLNELYLNEIEIISGIVPMQILSLGSKEIWLLNFEAGKFIRRNLLKRAMYLQVDDPNVLRKTNGSSSAEVRQYDLHIRHIDQSRIIDQGEAHLKWRVNPNEIGWFSTGTVFDIFDFQDMKSLVPTDNFRLRIQKSRQQKQGGPKEPQLNAEIVRQK